MQLNTTNAVLLAKIDKSFKGQENKMITYFDYFFLVSGKNGENEIVTIGSSLDLPVTVSLDSLKIHQNTLVYDYKPLKKGNGFRMNIVEYKSK